MAAEIQEAYCQGQQVIKAIYNFSPFFLLNGYTAMVYRNDVDALNNFWIAVEQLTGFLWAEHYVKNKSIFPARVAKCHSHVKGAIQRDQIWAKHQLLRLSKIISKECHKVLCQARGKRNDLVHDGIVPDIKVINALWKALPELIEIASGIRELGVRRLLGGGANNWAVPERTNFDEWAELATKV